MQLQRDKIIFESRREIETIEAALEQYLEDHHAENNADTVQRMIDLLDAMHMSW